MHGKTCRKYWTDGLWYVFVLKVTHLGALMCVLAEVTLLKRWILGVVLSVHSKYIRDDDDDDDDILISNAAQLMGAQLLCRSAHPAAPEFP